MLVSLCECIKLALASLRANKMRSALTLLGIVIGIASVITMMSMGEGARKLVTGEFVGMGSNLLFVQQDYTREDVRWGHVRPLTIEDADAIRKACPAVTDVSVTKVAPATVKSGTRRQNVNAMFTDDGLSSTHKGAFGEGRFLTELDVRARRPVAVLGGGLARKLFDKKGANGEKVKINGIAFIVVGVMREQGRTIFG
ncbi:MAG: ABC transporter permease, partial [Bacillota bacterium]